MTTPDRTEIAELKREVTAYATTVENMQREIDALKADAERLDWFDKQGYAYGFEDTHEGNRWMIEGPFMSVRTAIDELMAAP